VDPDAAVAAAYEIMDVQLVAYLGHVILVDFARELTLHVDDHEAQLLGHPEERHMGAAADEQRHDRLVRSSLLQHAGFVEHLVLPAQLAAHQTKINGHALRGRLDSPRVPPCPHQA
jgi:hypothetical protein